MCIILRHFAALSLKVGTMSSLVLAPPCLRAAFRSLFFGGTASKVLC